MAALKILVIPGSLRSGSHNVKLAMAMAHGFAQAGVDVTRLSLDDFPLPIYDGDLQAKSGVPRNAVNLKRMMGAHHGVLIVTPEYNSSIPSLLKNTIDWISRVQDPHESRGQIFRDKAFAQSAGIVVCRSGLRRYGQIEERGRYRGDESAGDATH
jgi:NAD(P)H-dependent FMN reductase